MASGPQGVRVVHSTVLVLLDIARGPLFRFAFTLMVLGMVRIVALGCSDMVGAYVTAADRSRFWHKVRLRILWLTFPSLVLHRLRPQCRGGMLAYHVSLCFTSMLFRLVAILLPAFLVAHVYLWKRGIGLTWPVLSGHAADTLAWIVIGLGVALFFGRLFSPALREIDPPWSFLKPLILIVPFITGVLAMHPTWSSVDYHVMLLLHTLSGIVVLVLVPFSRLLTCMHRPLVWVMPEAAWQGLTRRADAPPGRAQPAQEGAAR